MQDCHDKVCSKELRCCFQLWFGFRIFSAKFNNCEYPKFFISAVKLCGDFACKIRFRIWNVLDTARILRRSHSCLLWHVKSEWRMADVLHWLERGRFKEFLVRYIVYLRERGVPQRLLKDTIWRNYFLQSWHQQRFASNLGHSHGCISVPRQKQHCACFERLERDCIGAEWISSEFCSWINFHIHKWSSPQPCF